MLRRIIGITGIGLWITLIVFVLAHNVNANGEEHMFKNLPEGWKVEKSFLVSKEQMLVISNNIGGEISKLSNTILSFKGQRLQVNVLYCPTSEQAEKVYKAVLQTHNGIVDYVLIDANLVVEFANCADINLARQARQSLGLELTRLDNVAKTLIKRIPAEWEVVDSFIVPAEQTNAIGKKLGVSIKSLSNTIFNINEKHFQVNVIECLTHQDAEKIHESIIKTKADPSFGLRFGNSVVEFVGDDVELAKKAVYALGIKPMPIETQAKDLVNSLAKGDYNKAVANFDETMKKELPADKLKEVWNSSIVHVGAFVEQRGTRTEKIMGYDVVFVTCKFEKSFLDAKVVFDDRKQIAGLFFIPVK